MTDKALLRAIEDDAKTLTDNLETYIKGDAKISPMERCFLSDLRKQLLMLGSILQNKRVSE